LGKFFCFRINPEAARNKVQGKVFRKKARRWRAPAGVLKKRNPGNGAVLTRKTPLRGLLNAGKLYAIGA
jgi:hypothetical protein